MRDLRAAKVQPVRVGYARCWPWPPCFGQGLYGAPNTADDTPIGINDTAAVLVAPAQLALPAH